MFFSGCWFSQNNFNVIETDLFTGLKYNQQQENIIANEPVEREGERTAGYGTSNIAINCSNSQSFCFKQK